MVKDKKLVGRQFSRGFRTYNASASVQKHICEVMISRLSTYLPPTINKVFEIGCGTGFLTAELLKTIRPKQYLTNDLIQNSKYELKNIFDIHEYQNWSFIEGDAECIDFPKEVDLIISSSTIQWFNSFENFVIRAYNALTKGGLMAISTFGPENYNELKSISGAGLDYMSMRSHQQIISKYFNIMYADEERQHLWFDTSVDVLRHIKTIGANSLSNKFWSKGRLKDFEENYSRNFHHVNKGIRLTYHPIIIICEKTE